MVISYNHSICWRMKLVFYERQQPHSACPHRPPPQPLPPASHLVRYHPPTAPARSCRLTPPTAACRIGTARRTTTRYCWRFAAPNQRDPPPLPRLGHCCRATIFQSGHHRPDLSRCRSSSSSTHSLSSPSIPSSPVRSPCSTSLLSPRLCLEFDPPEPHVFSILQGSWTSATTVLHPTGMTPLTVLSTKVPPLLLPAR
jgi:hypothetical protein